MSAHTDPLPTDPEALRVLLLAERARHAETTARIAQSATLRFEEGARLRAIIQELQHHRFSRRSEAGSPPTGAWPRGREAGAVR